MTKTRATMTTADYDRIASVLRTQADEALFGHSLTALAEYGTVLSVKEALIAEFKNDPEFSEARFRCLVLGVEL